MRMPPLPDPVMLIWCKAPDCANVGKDLLHDVDAIESKEIVKQ